jgi:hypothetical protein
VSARNDKAPAAAVRIVAEADDPRPTAAERAALADAIRLDERLAGPLPPGAVVVRWFERGEWSGNLRGWISGERRPFPVFIAVGLGALDQADDEGPTVYTATHELCHVHQRLAGRRPTNTDEEVLEHEARVYGLLALEVWRMEHRSPSTPRAVAGR